MNPAYGLLANFALVGVILTSFALFFVKKPDEASLTFLMAAILFLPQGVNFKLPKLPPLSRDSLPYLCVLIVLVFRRPGWVRRARVGRGLDLIVFVSIVAALITAYLNQDALSFGRYGAGTQLPGHTLSDGFALAADDFMLMGIPFVLGRVLIRDARQAKRLVATFAAGGLLYTLFMLFEFRMSPQLHLWVYGYTARIGEFAQALRAGGYRPMVFMVHPLALAIFICNSVLAAFILVRIRHKLLGLSWKPFAFFLLVLLAACKCTASLIYALVAVSLISFTKPRTQLRVGVAITLIVLAYPALRGSDNFPTKTVLSVAKAMSDDREGSLGFRFDNEEKFLDRVRERPFFGWGTYGRNQVYEPYYGHKISTVDGAWIGVLGTRGIVGALCFFLLLTVPIWMAVRSLKKVPGKDEQIVLAGTATMLAFSTLDFLPNGLFANYAFLLAGALVGMTRVLASPAASDAPELHEWQASDAGGFPAAAERSGRGNAALGIRGSR